MTTAATKDEKNWGMLCHLAALAGYVIPLGNIIRPLFVWLVKKDEFSFVDDQGKESLNFQITMTIFIFVSIVLIIVLIGIPLLVGLAVLDLILVIVAAIKASEGQQYRYPLNIRFIR
jgi:hypothetical protein